MFCSNALLRPALIALALCSTAEGAMAQTSLDKELKSYLAKFELPALATAVVKDGERIPAGAVGTRRAGAEIPVTVNDRFHLGSDT
jgi:CubicO group peptidase (beta-lactamase class C family)